MPVGFDGLLMMTQRERGVIAASSRSGDSFSPSAKPLARKTGVPPATSVMPAKLTQ